MADTLTLDTSGGIEWVPHPYPGCKGKTYWTDLDPFTQGYVEALFAGAARWTEGRCLTTLQEWAGFSDLAPEALAMILLDCERWLARYPKTKRAREKGANAWRYRQEQLVKRPDFPPLTPTLGDDGKVYLREAGQ